MIWNLRRRYRNYARKRVRKKARQFDFKLLTDCGHAEVTRERQKTMKYCNVCSALKATDEETCPDCGAYLPKMVVVPPVVWDFIAAALFVIAVCIFIFMVRGE